MGLPKQSECLKLFGNPSAAGFAKKNLVSIVPPYQLRMGDIPMKRILINKVAAPSLTRVLANVWAACGRDPKKIADIHADQFSGSWAVRNARGLRMISMHAYGLAVDFDAPHNQLGAHDHFFKRGNPLVDAFLAEGWVWGGPWSRPDAMHFQYAVVD